MNPCPCGRLGEPRCHCTEDQVRRYRSKISGPLLDRIDIHVEVPRLPCGVLANATPGEDSQCVSERVVAARERQLAWADCINSALGSSAIHSHCRLPPNDQELLETAMERLGLSARAYHRIIRVARTSADLAGSETIATSHLSEAIGYRTLDRNANQSGYGYRTPCAIDMDSIRAPQYSEIPLIIHQATTGRESSCPSL